MPPVFQEAASGTACKSSSSLEGRIGRREARGPLGQCQQDRRELARFPFEVFRERLPQQFRGLASPFETSIWIQAKPKRQWFPEHHLAMGEGAMNRISV